MIINSNVSPAPSVITSISDNASGGIINSYQIVNTLSSAVFNVNAIRFDPFTLSNAVTVRNLFLINGSTINGNFDIGIYNSDFVKLVSTGSTAQSGANSVQVVSVGPLTIGPGVFYFAFNPNSSTATYYALSGTGAIDGVVTGRAAQGATVFPLPAVATPIGTASSSVVFIGLSTVPIV